ncbi:HD domain-containing protein [Caballeronia temeraria]|uniref:HD domain-containing protein n=1 Tax=Caballeronia temeraria TaxID=1777137 RepID=UPI0024466099|nr:HD domain-containing protein [Caballeronia temeraria]
MKTEASETDTFTAWGKRPRAGDEHSPCHPLGDHMLDVAACFLANCRVRTHSRRSDLHCRPNLD